MLKFTQKIHFIFLFLPIVSHAGQFLTSKEITQLISGRAMTFSGSYGPFQFTGAAKWEKNGTISGFTAYLDKKTHWKGKWYVKNNQYCRTLSADNRTDSKCHRVEKINANTINFIKEDGSISSTSVLK